jgi:hypothetical protein
LRKIPRRRCRRDLARRPPDSGPKPSSSASGLTESHPHF